MYDITGAMVRRPGRIFKNVSWHSVKRLLRLYFAGRVRLTSNWEVSR